MKAIKFLDKYEYYLLTVLLVLDFGITSIFWVASGPFPNTYFKIDTIIMFITTPLMPILLQIIIKFLPRDKIVYDQKTKDIFKILIFSFNFFLFGMSLVMQFLEFNIFSYNLMRLLWTPIILPYMILILRNYFKDHFRLVSIIFISVFTLGFIGSLFWVDTLIISDLKRWVVDIYVAIAILIVITIYSIYSLYRGRNRVKD